MGVEDLTLDEVWDALQAEIDALAPPPSAFTKRMLADRFEINEDQARRMLDKWIKDGAVREWGQYGPGHPKWYEYVRSNNGDSN